MFCHFFCFPVFSFFLLYLVCLFWIHNPMDDLTISWNNLTLSDKEKTEFTLSIDQRLGEFIIAAKSLTPRFLVMDGVARTFKQLWHSTNGFKIQHLGDHKVLFVFDNLADVDRILKSQPWSFDKHLVVIQRYDYDTPARELRFNKATFGFKFMISQLGICPRKLLRVYAKQWER